MGAPWYSATGNPADSAQGSSAVIRAEFAAIEAAMDKLPALMAGLPIRVNAGGSGLEAVSAATMRTTIGLDSASAVSFASLALSGGITASAATLSGALSVAGTLTLAGVAITANAAEINYLQGVTSNVQTQINNVNGLSTARMRILASLL